MPDGWVGSLAIAREGSFTSSNFFSSKTTPLSNVKVITQSPDKGPQLPLLASTPGGLVVVFLPLEQAGFISAMVECFCVFFGSIF
jgi:hypothetical protein